MSVRIHELAKRIEMDNKELLSLLKDRGFAVKTVSSTIDTINAEAIEEEFRSKQKTGAPAEAEPSSSPAAPPAGIEATNKPATNKPAGDAPSASTVLPPPRPPMPGSAASGTFSAKLPAGVFVKSAADIAREKAEAEQARQAARVIAPPPFAAGRGPATLRPRSAVVAPPPPPPPRSAAPAPSLPAAPPTVAAPPPTASPRPGPAPLSAPRPAPAPLPISRPTVLSAPAPAAAPAVPPLPASTGEESVATPAAELKVIQLKPPVVVREFAMALGLKPFRLISEMMEMGIFASLNQAIEEAVAVKIAEKHGFLLEVKHRGEAPATPVVKEKKPEPEVDELTLMEPRPPVVCILGHVDHGKTTLLDTIRKANVAAGEAGGITQHIGAYQIEVDGRKITFLDTPGHAAFNKMRARGASVTDIAVLVVAADDGFMPQTDEALRYIKDAKVALIVAINKADVKGANFDRVKLQMQERGIAPEDWGGETIAVKVSALKGEGVHDLLEYIALQADIMELKANPKAPASGTVIESQIEVGRGSTATVIVQRGTLRVGDAVVCGAAYTKVKALFDDRGGQLKQAGPSTPVKIIGWSATPEVGQTFKVVKNEREAKALAEEAEFELRQKQQLTAAVPKDTSIDALFANIAANQKRTLKVVLKSDVYGSAEAVRGLLEGIKSDKVGLEIVATDVGPVSKNDVLLASASGAIVIGFNTRSENGVAPFAKHQGVAIHHFEIIYELADRVREFMADLLEPELKEVRLGAAEVRAIFPVGKGFVAGCLVTEGKVTRNARARVRRGREAVHESSVDTLRRFKDDANEVRAGLECGIRLAGFDGYEQGDIIECFEVQKIRASL
jgi:translation initiation factor IF-2